MLRDGTWLGLDHPAFDRLRALLSEAATLQEWTPESTAVSRHQVGFWEDLKEVADELHEDPEWTAAVGRLASAELDVDGVDRDGADLDQQVARAGGGDVELGVGEDVDGAAAGGDHGLAAGGEGHGATVSRSPQ